MKAVQLNGVRRPEGYDQWAKTNLYQQRQTGYYVATVTCPLGDLTSDQMRALADIAGRYAGGNARTTVEQNIVLRWIPHDKTIDLYKELAAIGLGEAGAGTIVDVVACPGTDTCKLGIASSRGLAGELRHRLAAKNASLDQAIRGLRIKVSGCFNSCGQHHVGGHRLLRQQPEHQRIHRPAFPGDARRTMDPKRRQLCPGHGLDPVQADPRSRSNA